VLVGVSGGGEASLVELNPSTFGEALGN